MAKKRSGTKASTIAGRVLHEITVSKKLEFGEVSRDAVLFRYITKNFSQKHIELSFEPVCTVGELLTLAASVLSQDEVKGQRRGKR